MCNLAKWKLILQFYAHLNPLFARQKNIYYPCPFMWWPCVISHFPTHRIIGFPHFLIFALSHYHVIPLSHHRACSRFANSRPTMIFPQTGEVCDWNALLVQIWKELHVVNHSGAPIKMLSTGFSRFSLLTFLFSHCSFRCSGFPNISMLYASERDIYFSLFELHSLKKINQFIK